VRRGYGRKAVFDLVFEARDARPVGTSIARLFLSIARLFLSIARLFLSIARLFLSIARLFLSIARLIFCLTMLDFGLIRISIPEDREAQRVRWSSRNDRRTVS
jgi:hypothetical protein